MGACLSSPAEGAGGRASLSSDGRSGRKETGKSRKRKARREGKGGGWSDRRGGGVTDPAELLAKVEAGVGLTDEELHRVPGRMPLNGSSDSACLFTQQGRKGTNQDAMIVWEVFLLVGLGESQLDIASRFPIQFLLGSVMADLTSRSKPRTAKKLIVPLVYTKCNSSTENFASRDDTIFCGVFDGHGPFGHMVAKKVRDSLPLKLCAQWKTNASDQNNLQQNDTALGSMNSEETSSIGKGEWSESIDGDEDKLPEIYQILRRSLFKSFKLMDKELDLHPTIDCFCSGTTAVTLVKQFHGNDFDSVFIYCWKTESTWPSSELIGWSLNIGFAHSTICRLLQSVQLALLQGQDLVIANVGDSRAVLGTRDKDNSLIAVQLTVDLKPNLPRESARIQQCKGRVFALQDEPEVARVWLPNNDSPGLAMARAFGDFCLKDYGLISVPDISYRHLTDGDEFIILATDGVWDVLSNKEAVDVVASAPSRATAARALVDTAVRSWRLKFPTSKIDDCAVVCLFLDLRYSSDLTQDAGSEKSCDYAVDINVVACITQETTGEDLNESVSTTQDNRSASEHPDFPGDTEILPASETKEEKLQEWCQSTRSLADCISATEEAEWSALEGVTRVNSLVNLPRFLSGDKKSTSWKKWL